MTTISLIQSHYVPKGTAYVLPDVTMAHRLGETIEEWYSRVMRATAQYGRVVILCGTRQPGAQR